MCEAILSSRGGIILETLNLRGKEGQRANGGGGVQQQRLYSAKTPRRKRAGDIHIGPANESFTCVLLEIRLTII